MNFFNPEQLIQLKVNLKLLRGLNKFTKSVMCPTPVTRQCNKNFQRSVWLKVNRTPFQSTYFHKWLRNNFSLNQTSFVPFVLLRLKHLLIKSELCAFITYQANLRYNYINFFYIESVIRLFLCLDHYDFLD